MQKIIPDQCKKCGGDTKITLTESLGIKWFEGEKTSGLKQICNVCGFSEFILDIEELNEKLKMMKLKNDKLEKLIKKYEKSIRTW